MWKCAGSFYYFNYLFVLFIRSVLNFRFEKKRKGHYVWKKKRDNYSSTITIMHHHVFSYLKPKQKIHNIFAVNKKIPTSWKTYPLTGQHFIDPYFHWFSKSRDIDVTMSKRLPDSRNWRTRIFKHLMDMCEWKKWIFF